MGNKVCVIIDSQQQLDEVYKFNAKSGKLQDDPSYKKMKEYYPDKAVCKEINSSQWSKVEYYTSHLHEKDTKIISFQGFEKEYLKKSSDVSPCGKFKVGDFVGEGGFTSKGEFHEILKIEGDKFWIDYNEEGYKEYHNYTFSSHLDLKKKEGNSFFNKEEKEEKIKLVPGKWYKNLSHSKDYIAKFKELKSNYFYSWNGEYIYKGSLSNASDSPITDDWQDAIECTLEEIQQYLPEGHVDKIKTVLKKVEKINPNTNFIFTPGNIYVGTWDGYRVIFKLSTGFLRDTCQIIDTANEFIKDSDGTCTGDNISFRDATNEEKQWLQACIDAGKTVSREEALKQEVKMVDKQLEFVKGQWYEFDYCGDVTYLFKFEKREKDNIYSSNYTTLCGKHKSSLILNLVDVSSARNMRIASTENVYKYFPEEKPKMKEKAKVGQWIIAVTPKNTGGCSLEAGKAYKVEKVTDIYTATGIWGGDINHKDYRMAEAHEVPTEFIESPKEKSLVGRWVKALTDYPNGGSVKKGEIGRFTSEHHADFPSQKGYSLTLPKPGYYELMPKEWSPETKNKPIFKKGEWVIIIDFGGASASGSFTFNTPYKLFHDFTEYEGFHVEKDNEGHLNNGWSNAWSLGIKVRKALPEEISGNRSDIVLHSAETDVRKMSKEQLTIEVKKRYPVGTKFYAAHLTKSERTICGVYDYDKLLIIDTQYGDIDLYSSDSRNKVAYTGRVLNKWNWAEIVSPKEVPKMESYDDWCVKCTSENREDIVEYFKPRQRFDGTSEFFYGEEKLGVKCKPYKWGTLLTTEEFLKKIGKSIQYSDETLLEEARRRYPVGTRFDSTGGWRNCLVIEDCKKFYWEMGEITLRRASDGDLIGRVYKKSTNEWGKILSFPQKEAVIKVTDVELYKPKQNTQINEKVDKIQSISNQLVKPKKVVLF